MRFTLTIDCDNAAFGDGHDAVCEVARILDTVSERLRDYDSSGACMDANGNKVGEYGFSTLIRRKKNASA